MRQRKLLRSDALTCGPPKLDDKSWTPSLGPISSYFYRVPRRACMQGHLLYADGEAYMYMLSAHHQIEPARPSITSTQAKKQGRRASHGQGAWSFVKRARFKIAARVGQINATAPRSKLALAGFGWHWQKWLALAGAGWLLLAVAGCS